MASNISTKWQWFVVTEMANYGITWKTIAKPEEVSDLKQETVEAEKKGVDQQKQERKLVFLSNTIVYPITKNSPNDKYSYEGTQDDNRARNRQNSVLFNQY